MPIEFKNNPQISTSNGRYSIILSWAYSSPLPDSVGIYMAPGGTDQINGDTSLWALINRIQIPNSKKNGDSDSYTVQNYYQSSIALPCSVSFAFCIVPFNNNSEQDGFSVYWGNIIIECPPGQTPSKIPPHITGAVSIPGTIHHGSSVNVNYVSNTKYYRYQFSWGLVGDEQNQENGNEYDFNNFSGVASIYPALANTLYWIRVKGGQVTEITNEFIDMSDWSQPDYIVKTAAKSRSIRYFFENPVNGIRLLMNSQNSVKKVMGL